MNGRLELQEKTINKCNTILSTLPPYVTLWYSELRVSGKSPQTCLNYIYKVNDYISTLPDKEITSLTKASVNEYLISKQTVIKNGTKCQSSKANQQISWSALNSFFTYLESENLMSNPIKPGTRPSGDDLDKINEHRVLLTHNDFNKILTITKNGFGTEHQRCYHQKTYLRDTAVMYLFMYTGLRESALISLNKSDIDYKNETLFIYDKGEIPHKFNIKGDCIKAIREYISTRDDDLEALFVVTRKGITTRMSVQNVIAITKKYSEAALGKALSPHKFRAGVCSILYKKTGDIEFVRRFIGHSSSEITKRYIVTKGKESDKGNEILGDLLE